MQTNEAIKLETAKDFPAGVAQLYRAWTSPEALKQWWHPMGNQLQEVTNDLKPGGKVEYKFTDEKGAHSLTINGTYEQVQPEALLVYSWNWQVPAEVISDSSYKLHVRFSGSGNQSRLEVTQENFSDDEAVHPHRQGWEKALEELRQFLAK